MSYNYKLNHKKEQAIREVYLLYKEISDFDSRVVEVFGDKAYAQQRLNEKQSGAAGNEYFYLKTGVLPVTLDYGISECVIVDGVSHTIKMPQTETEKYLEDNFGLER